MTQPQELLPGISIHPQSIDTARGPVEYDLTPGDGPVVVLSHGGLGGVDQARLAGAWVDLDRYRLLSVSRPGYLGTPLSSGPGIADQADLFAALLDALGLDRAAMVSVSAGGPFAYQFGISHADRCWALIAIDSVSGYYKIPETAGAVAQAVFTTDLGQKFLKILTEKRTDLALKQLFQSEAYFTKDQIKAHMDHVLNNPEVKAFAVAFVNAMNPYNPRKAGTENDMACFEKLHHMPVEQVTTPTLVIHGTHDADVKFYDGVYAYEHIPGAQRHWIEEGSHLGFWLSPNAPAAQAAARDFLDRHRP